MKKTISLVILALVVLAGCDKDKPEPEQPAQPQNPTTGTLKINFVPQYNGAPFLFHTDFYNSLNQRVQFEMLRFFMTEFYVKTSAGDSVMVRNAVKYDFEQPAGNTFSATLNPGNYTGMRFSFGVDSAENHGDPTALDPANPLSYNQANTMHWGWASGYIFMKMEAKADISGTGTGSLSQFLAYHPGDDKCYRQIPFLSKSFSITAGSTTTLNIIVNVARFIDAPGDTFDLTVDCVTHYSDNVPLAGRLANNITTAFAFE